jgi:hypothetical protein
MLPLVRSFLEADWSLPRDASEVDVDMRLIIAYLRATTPLVRYAVHVAGKPCLN